MHRYIEIATQWLRRVVTQPLQELDRWQSAVRFAYDLGRFGARQLRQDRAQDMAAALAFHTLFGMLPVMVVMTAIVKAANMQPYFLGPLDQMFTFWGLGEVKILLPGDAEEATSTLSVWLMDRVREAENVNLGAVGWVGLGLTVYAAINLVVTIEDCFNVIYQAPEGRSWTRRVPLYWFVLTTSPVAIWGSTYINGWFEQYLPQITSSSWLSTSANILWSVCIIWVLMFLLYRMLPNTIIYRRPALVGSLVAALLLEIGKHSLGLYLQNALSLSQLYGSLGLIPLFMFWVYLMWLAVLFGLQVSSTLQHLRGRQLAEMQQQRQQSLVVDPGMIVVMMQHVAQQFRQGQSTNTESIARATKLSEAVTERMVNRLVEANMLRRLDETDHQVVLARPADTISIRELLEVAYAAIDRELGQQPEATQLLLRLRDAQTNAVADTKLQSLLDVPS